MTKEEALQKLAAEDFHAAGGQNFAVYRMAPEDAWGVVRCFHAVYGREYPIDSSYIPERLVEENAAGTRLSVVGRAIGGDIVCYGALYRTSSPNPRLFELGQFAVLPAYRGSLATHHMNRILLQEVAPERDVAVVFGEAVCNHAITQKLGAVSGFEDCGIEIGLMPAAAYPRPEFPRDRVSNVMAFLCLHAQPQVAYVPAVYREWIERILAGTRLERTLETVPGGVPASGPSRMEQEYFDFAQVSRTRVLHAGEDFGPAADRAEAAVRARGAQVLQYFLDLGDPSVSVAVAALRQRGYFFGGFLPYWFETDGLFMQKVLDMPDFRSICLHSSRAKTMLEWIRSDIQAVA